MNARLNMLLLAPVAHGLTETAEAYPYSSANPRYRSNVANYAGFPKSVPTEKPALSTETAEAGSTVVAEETKVGDEGTPPSAEATEASGT